MSFSDETLMAYVDGEVDETTRAAIDAAIAAHPELAGRVTRHRALRERLHQELDPVMQEPVPERLLAAARSVSRSRAGTLVLLPRIPLARWSWPQWGAMAASLVVGILLAPLLWRQPPAPVGVRNGQLLASGPLARALAEQLANTQSANTPVRMGVSFISRRGNYCRTFVLRDRSALAGVACREPEGWVLRAVATAPSAETGEYRPAASALPPVIAGTVNDLIDGEPLDASAEVSARASGWQR
jgi:hypothetical protein